MKRNYIKLIQNADEVMQKNAEPKFETFITPAFIPLRTTVSLAEFMANDDQNESEANLIYRMADLVTDIYGGQFTKDDVLDRLHAPDALVELREQIQFVTEGQQSDERKKELAKMV